MKYMAYNSSNWSTCIRECRTKWKSFFLTDNWSFSNHADTTISTRSTFTYTYRMMTLGYHGRTSKQGFTIKNYSMKGLDFVFWTIVIKWSGWEKHTPLREMNTLGWPKCFETCNIMHLNVPKFSRECAWYFMLIPIQL